jgi:predicted DNA-binding transcriptional regulator AlpA
VTVAPITMTERQTLSLAEAARVLGISQAAAYRQLAAGTFPVPVLRIGGRIKVSRYVLESYLTGEAS